MGQAAIRCRTLHLSLLGCCIRERGVHALAGLVESGALQSLILGLRFNKIDRGGKLSLAMMQRVAATRSLQLDVLFDP